MFYRGHMIKKVDKGFVVIRKSEFITGKFDTIDDAQTFIDNRLK